MNPQSDFVPDPPDDEISRGGWIADMERLFGPDRPHQTIVGGPQTGKSNLLAQFARAHKGHAISYFPDNSPVCYLPHHYLYVLCIQMAEILDKKEPSTSSSLEQLVRIYSSLSAKLQSQSKATGTRYYYVIDGIERFLVGTEGNRIVDYFPPRLGSGVYMLSSLFEGDKRRFPLDKIGTDSAPRRFELQETEWFLAKASRSKEQTQRIYDICQGHPGYLRLIKQSPDLGAEINIGNLPAELKELATSRVEIAKRQMQEHQLAAVDLMAAIPVSVPMTLLERACGSLTEADIAAIVESGLAVRTNGGLDLGISNPVLREAVVVHSRLDKAAAAKQLIEAAKDARSSDSPLLNILLQVSKDYDAISSTLAPTSLVMSIQTSPSAIPDIMARTKLASDLAFEHDYSLDLIRWALVTSIRKSFVLHVSSRPEIEALLALRRFDEAHQQLNQIPDVYARVIALCRAVTSERLAGVPPRREAEEEIRNLLTLVPYSELDRDSLEELALEVFPVFSDEAERILQRLDANNVSDLVEEWSREESKTQQAQISPARERLVSLMGRQLLRNPSMDLGSSWLRSLSFLELTSKLQGMSSTRGKARMIRRWCEVQDRTVDILPAVSLWIDTVINDEDTTIHLSSLRSLADALRIRTPLGSGQSVAERINTLASSQLVAPQEEWIKCRLAIAEILGSSSLSDGIARTLEIVEHIVDRHVDLDVEVFCLARAWLALNRMGTRVDDPALLNVRSRFQIRLNELLKSSAEHLELLDETIGMLTEIDPAVSLITASLLNTRSRRSMATISILMQLARHKMAEDVASPMVDALSMLDSNGIASKSSVVVVMAELIQARKMGVHAKNFDVLLTVAEGSNNPRDKALIFTDLHIIAKRLGLSPRLNLLESAEVAWNQEQKLPSKIALGYNMVALLAKHEPEFSGQFHARVRQIANTKLGNLAQGELGLCYQRLIETSIRLLRIADLDDPEVALSGFHLRIDRLVAPEVQAIVYAKLISRIHQLGRSDIGYELIRQFLIPKVEALTSREAYDQAMWFSFPLWFDYDDRAALLAADKMLAAHKQSALYVGVLWHLTHFYLGNPTPNTGFISQKTSIRSLRTATRLLSGISHDADFLQAVEAIAAALSSSFEQDVIDLAMANDVLGEIERAIDSNLPDMENIQHHGYVILARVEVILAKTRMHIVQSNRNGSSRLMIPETQNKWNQIFEQSRSLENIADRLYVQAEIARRIGTLPPQWKGDKLFTRSLKTAAITMASQARLELNAIPTMLDRCDRMAALAEACHSLSKSDLAELIISELTSLMKQLSGASRDEVHSLAIQSAYKVSPRLAEDMADKLKIRQPETIRLAVDADLLVRRLVSDPANLQNIDSSVVQLDDIVSRAVQDYLSGISGGRIYCPPSRLVNSWLLRVQQCDTDAINMVINWSISVFASSNNESNLPSFVMSLELADIVHALAQVGTTLAPTSDVDADVGAPRKRKIHALEMGERERARRLVRNWLEKNCNGYLTICDPFFTLDGIEWLLSVPIDCIVTIVTCDRELGSCFDADARTRLQEELRHRWSQISQHRMPQLTLFVVNKAEEGTFHDRALATRNAVLVLGQSLEGLGNQIATLTELYDQEAEEFEDKYIVGMLSQPYWIRKGVSPLIVQPNR